MKWNSEMLENIYLSIEEISNIKFQKKLWENKIPGMISSYIEAVCSLFDDSCFDIFIDDYLNRIEVSKEFKEKIENLREELNLFDGSEMTNRQIFKHPKWINIAEIAKVIISQWNKEIIGNESNYQRARA